MLGARIVAAWGDPELAAAVGSAMTKVEAVLHDTLRRVVLETPFFAPGLPGASAMAGELALLRRAIGERRLVHFRYAREDGAESERAARPLGLYFWGRKWTLAAWCELRSDYRSFRPDRMREVALLEERFDPAEGISLAGFLAKGDPADWEKWEWPYERARAAAAAEGSDATRSTGRGPCAPVRGARGGDWHARSPHGDALAARVG